MVNEKFISDNIASVRKISDAYGAALCAVIKNRSCDEIAFAVTKCGVKIVGENRVQELLTHYETLKNSGAEIHFIGHLQRNKVKYIADKVALIESLDSVPLAAEIQRQMEKLGGKMSVLIEVNIGEEPQKSGVYPSDLPALLDGLKQFDRVVPRGLMTVAPKCGTAEEAEKYFRALRALLDGVFLEKFPDAPSPVLSMGMSGDFKAALAAGSTEIRIGTGIFGARETVATPDDQK